MRNDNRTIHRSFAALAFLVAFATYLLTVQPTVPFWDCGEFTAAAVGQQVPHPPGAPLFLMIGKLFHLLPFGDPGWRVNLVSVFSSAVCVLLLYLITVRVIRNFYDEDLDDIGNALAVYGGGLVAALTLTFSSTFWFNAVESEVYAASTLFVALIVWLMMVWNSKADEEGHERYLLLIAYLIGLSIGVHLLSILTIFSITLLVYLRRYPVTIKGLLITGLIGVLIFGITYYGAILRLPALLAGHLPIKNDAGEWLVVDNVIFTILGVALIAGAFYGVWFFKQRGRPILAMVSMTTVLLVVGYSSYTHILIRSNQNPPMNENEPKDLDELVRYLGREQYGEAPMWPRRYQTEDRFVVNYRKYGAWSPPPVKRSTRRDGSVIQRPDYGRWKTDKMAELSYMWDYQANHMYLRYFLWNFSGRVSDKQDAGAYTLFTSGAQSDNWNFKNGYADQFPINYFMLPLILGIVGMVFHFSRDKKMAFVYLSMFLMMGILAALQQNQQNPQPRERDYFYTGSFMIWCMWIGMGAFSVIQSAMARKKSLPLVAALLSLCIAAVPVNMAAQNWHVHSRAGNYLAFDYAYNILQSAEPNAIIFTNGDNDTFPVWYMQDVAGVRRDVRIVNLSLGQTLWYVRQLKHAEPYGALKIPLSFTDAQLFASDEDRNALTYNIGPARVISVNVDPKIMAKFTSDSSILANPVMQWTFKGREWNSDKGQPNYFFGVQHQLVADIIAQTRFERPVYFSSSVGDPSWADEFVGLDSYLRWEGLCYRVVPVPQRSIVGQGFNEEVMDATLLNVDNSDNFSTTAAYGMKLRNLHTETPVYYDDVGRGYLMNYRNVYMRYANWLLFDKADTAKAIKVISTMNELISPEKFPMPTMVEYRVVGFLEEAGDFAHAERIAAQMLKDVKTLAEKPSIPRTAREYGADLPPEFFMAEAYKTLGEFDEAKSALIRMAGPNPQDQYVKFLIDEIDLLRKMREKDWKGALDIAYRLNSMYAYNPADPSTREASMKLAQSISRIMKELGVETSFGEASSTDTGR